MARSGSYDWNITRNEIISSALRIIGELDPQETPSAEDITTGSEALNMLLKSWSNTVIGLQLWTKREATVFPQVGKYAYTLGTSDAPSAWSYTTVALQSTANTGTTVVIPSGVGATGDYIGIRTGASSQWTTIATLSSSGTAHLAASLTSTATASANVWIFTNLMESPVDILHARIGSSNDIKLHEIERDTYLDIYDKDRAGEPRRYYFDRQLDNPVFYTDYAPDDPNELIKIVYRRPFEDLDASTDNPGIPIEVVRALKWNLASEIMQEYGVPPGSQSRIETKAAESLLLIRSIYGERPRSSIPSTLV